MTATPTTDVAARIAAQTLLRRKPGYADEVRRLLDAALVVIAERGTTNRARVADIVAAAGLSNDAFYRHFASKDALIHALIEDGTARVVGHVAHQMQDQSTAEGRIRQWVVAVLAQTEDDPAAMTLAVMRNGTSTADGTAAGTHAASVALAQLLHEPFAELGSTRPELDASLVAHAVVGELAGRVIEKTTPDADEIDHIVRFCVDAARGRRPR